MSFANAKKKKSSRYKKRPYVNWDKSGAHYWFFCWEELCDTQYKLWLPRPWGFRLNGPMIPAIIFECSLRNTLSTSQHKSNYCTSLSGCVLNNLLAMATAVCILLKHPLNEYAACLCRQQSLLTIPLIGIHFGETSIFLQW